MNMDFKDFLLWEQSTHDVLDFKKSYVDMCGDVLAGLMLSELIYWHLPNKNQESKLRIQKEGKWWIAVRRTQWWDRTRLSPRQADRAIAILKEKGLIETGLFKFFGEPTMHIHLLEDVFLEQLDKVLKSPLSNPHATPTELRIREIELTKTDKTLSRKQVNPLTETTPEITTPPARVKILKSDLPDWQLSHGELPSPSQEALAAIAESASYKAIAERLEKGLRLGCFPQTTQAQIVYRWIAKQEASGQSLDAFIKWVMGDNDRRKYAYVYHKDLTTIKRDWPRVFDEASAEPVDEFGGYRHD